MATYLIRWRNVLITNGPDFEKLFESESLNDVEEQWNLWINKHPHVTIVGIYLLLSKTDSSMNSHGRPLQ